MPCSTAMAWSSTGSLTGDRDADRLLSDNPFALLVGMLHLQCRTPQDDAGHDKQQKQQPDEQQGYTVARTRFGGTWKLMSWHMIGAVGSRIISYRCGRVPSMHRPICSRPQAVLPPRRP
jgi:hypothetical protein